MVVAEVLTGISLVKASVDFIKSNINTANDISQIAKQIDDLFKGEKQIQKQRNKGGFKKSFQSQFGVENVAQEVIDAKLAQEQIQEISTMVDMRFGHGTWAGIIAERSRRIQKAKEEERELTRQRLKRKEEFQDTAILISVILASVVAVGGIAVIIILGMA
tara:strand:+ start:6051 stop:6533 length:483 start_codon:yes stop_codon:yes gene_type:complete